MARRRPITFLSAAAAIPVIALVVAGCGSSNSATVSTSSATTSSGHTATVGAATNGSLGKILVDSQGRTLYLFQADKGTKSACTGACAVAWPPVRASGKPVAGSGITASKLGTTARSDGKPQVTYNGHPLYTFANDQKDGDTSGQGINAFGGLWYVLSPAGTTITSSGSRSGGGGNSY